MFQYTQYKQTIAFSLSNLFLGHDKWELVGDWRYYDLPTYTYGLGTNTTVAQQHQINYSYLRVYEVVMRKVAKNFDMGIGYHLDYRWGIQDIDAEKGITTDFQTYGFAKKSTSSGFSANVLYDSRSNVNSPRDGTYFNMQFRSNLKAVGSNTNWNSFTIDARQYLPLPTKWRTGFAFWAYLWTTVSGTPPYLDLPSTGWDTYNNTGRGYALGRFRGLNMLYLESEFRFGILKNDLLGGVVFTNLQSFSDYPANYLGTFQPGVGFGLRVKINKRTDTSSAIDFGFGTHGSRGFSFNLNEVF
jgi:outer membrane protein assembly factor BamA